MKLAAKTILLLLALTSIVRAQNISGTVFNGTLRKPAAGDEVLLLHFGQGLQQVARTTTDANGHYSFKFSESGPYVVRVIHQGQVYDREPHPGAKSVDAAVFDTASDIKQISTSLILVGLQPQNDALEVVELHVIDNTSNPPRVSDSASGLETPLPAGAELEWVRGMAPGQRPIRLAAVPTANGNSYFVHFALRPGPTRLQIAYRLKYSGSTRISLQFPVAVPRVAIVVPDGLRFTAANGLRFQRVAEQGAQVETLAGVAPGQEVTFNLAASAVAAPALQDKIAESRRLLTPPPAAGDQRLAVDSAVDSDRGTVVQTSPATRRSAYVLTGLLIVVGIAIVWLRVVRPLFSIAARRCSLR